MYVEKIMELPAQVILKATKATPRTEFNFSLFKNHSRELRVCYTSSDEVEIVIPWDPYGPVRNWIFLIENIDDDTCLMEAVLFVQHELLSKAKYFENPWKFTTTKA